MNQTFKGAMVAAAVAGLFAGCSSGGSQQASGGSTSGSSGSTAASGGEVLCAGINECKGTGTCGAADHCSAENECKGKGVTKVATGDECTQKGGTVAQPAPAK